MPSLHLPVVVTNVPSISLNVLLAEHGTPSVFRRRILKSSGDSALAYSELLAFNAVHSKSSLWFD